MPLIFEKPTDGCVFIFPHRKIWKKRNKNGHCDWNACVFHWPRGKLIWLLFNSFCFLSVDILPQRIQFIEAWKSVVCQYRSASLPLALYALSLRARTVENWKKKTAHFRSNSRTAKTAAKFNFHPICYFRNVCISIAKNPIISLHTKNDRKECKMNQMQILTMNHLNWKWRRWRRMFEFFI